MLKDKNSRLRSGRLRRRTRTKFRKVIMPAQGGHPYDMCRNFRHAIHGVARQRVGRASGEIECMASSPAFGWSWHTTP
jgi:hypothetical protein